MTLDTQMTLALLQELLMALRRCASCAQLVPKPFQLPSTTSFLGIDQLP